MCATVTAPDQALCVTQDQLDACTSAPSAQRCNTESIAMGCCYDGMCLPIGCGNGRVDQVDAANPQDLVGEVCDDGDQTSGDGCSADCLSLETCGNGVVDSTKLERRDDGNLLSHDRSDSVCQIEQQRWSRLDAGTPAERVDHAMAYDTARQQTVLFGGRINRGTFATYGDTWTWDGNHDPTESPSLATAWPPDGVRRRTSTRRAVRWDGRLSRAARRVPSAMTSPHW